MSGLITNVQTADAYTDAATIQGAWTSRGGNFEVANAAVYYQLQYGGLGADYWTDESYLSPTAGAIEPGTIGIRFRSFQAGTPARVFARIAEGKEPVLTGTQFAGTVTAQGQVIAQGITQLEALCTGALTTSQAFQDLTGASVAFTITGNNATIEAHWFADSDIQVTGTGLVFTRAVLDGVPIGTAAIQGDPGVGFRSTVGQTLVASVAAGTHALKLQSSKTNAGGTCVIQTGSRLDVTVKDA